MPIVVQNLTHIYMRGTPMEHAAVEDISLTINDGEFLGVIGHTGSGKSTFIQHLNALMQPTGGTITVNGINLADKKHRIEVRKLVGMVFQYAEYQLFEETVEQDIAFGPLNLGVSEEETKMRVKDALEKVGLSYEKFADKSPFELSGGQKRRVALAGILAMKPSFLVLDEPMAGLDPRGRTEILELIKSFHSQGMTIVMVSHSMDDIAALATRVLVMNKSKIFDVGTPQEVFSRADELIKIGLDLPAAARTAKKLRDRGIEVPREIIAQRQLEDFIAGRIKNA